MIQHTLLALAAEAAEYGQDGRTRPAADPLGMRGLPDRRDALDGLWRGLCDRLAAIGPRAIEGRALVVQMGLRDTRALRLLVAYGRVWHHEHKIVGVAGSGYLWGGDDPKVYKAAAEDARRRGRCYLFLSALFRRQGSAMAIAQLALDAVGHGAGEAGPPADDLAALVAAEGVRIGDVLGALIGVLSETPDGREVLQQVASEHAAVLLPASVADELARDLDAIKQRILGGRRVGADWTEGNAMGGLRRDPQPAGAGSGG